MYNIARICFDQDCEPIWMERDQKVKAWCQENGIKCVESIGHTLWNPQEVIKMNGGTPPVTFSMFNHVVSSIGLPPRPLPTVDLTKVKMADIKEATNMFKEMPKPEDFGRTPDPGNNKIYIGGESQALEHLKRRLEIEADAFMNGSFLPNRRNPELLCPPKSLSPDLKFGSLSIRYFYWGVMNAYKESQKNTDKPFNPQIVVQLLWREFFYVMSVNNQFYGEMERNEICINIPWYPSEGNPNLKAFLDGKTGFPFIDAGVRQIKTEGWAHHIIRNALAFFLTRGDLWLNWEEGLQFFLQYLIDADWAVCAGNWMWISSSAFEEVSMMFVSLFSFTTLYI